MASTKPSTQIDIAASLRRAAAQFRELNPKEPGQWPLLPKVVSCVAVAVIVVAVGWVALLSDADKSLQASRDKEPKLKTDYPALMEARYPLGLPPEAWAVPTTSLRSFTP